MNKTYYNTIHKIITMGHWVTDKVGQELKEFGITEPQYNVLLILKSANGEPLTVQVILNGMVQRSSNVTRIIDKLLAKGYVNRSECCTNRRKMDITITEEGIKLLRKLNKKVYAIHKPMMENLDEKELELLNQLISKLNSTKND
ncbi:MAG: MarR family transcriptional regulator [Flammeovirgaceae bacterium]|nr:MarR family transcriptional regulator [Flammeovirgaceae bacterium]